KPSNIIWQEAPDHDRAMLTDFGLARSARPSDARSPGAARYVSPEQAGLLERGVDARSDLYSLGVVLFECLAGAAPFDGGTIGRAGELADFERALASAAEGQGGVLLLEAESGGGKTRLLEEMVRRALVRRPSPAFILRGQGTDITGGAQRPLQLLDGVVRDVI